MQAQHGLKVALLQEGVVQIKHGKMQNGKMVCRCGKEGELAREGN